MSLLVEISDASFKEHVENDRSGKVILVDFWAPWCGPCRQLIPVLEKLAENNTKGFEIIKMNVDDNSETPVRMGVRGIPHLVLFRDGKVIATKVGALSNDALVEWISNESGLSMNKGH